MATYFWWQYSFFLSIFILKILKYIFKIINNLLDSRGRIWLGEWAREVWCNGERFN